jgi:DNA-binding transcriptional ArsR family regulator
LAEPFEPRTPTRIEMWATAHPVRLRIFELLREGPSTASRLGRRIGESSGTTSYHLRMLERANAIEDAPGIGTKRERWWRRRDQLIVVPTDDDPEGRAITARMFAIFFARDAEVRGRFMAAQPEVPAEWHRGAFAGNWFVSLTPDEAADFGTKVLQLVEHYRSRKAPDGADRALVSVSALPLLEAPAPG